MDKEIIKHFDKIFGTDILKKINFEDKKLLNEIYDKFEEDILEPTPRYKQLRHNLVEVADNLVNSLTEEQQNFFNKYDEIYNELHCIEFKQVFIFGYLMSKQLDIEGKVIDEQD